MNVAVDTNVLAYAEGLNDAAKRDIALSILEALPPESTFLPVQTLGELFSVLVRKARRPAAAAAEAVLSWGDAFPLIESSGDVLLAATDLAQAHAVGLWDALILSAAAEARCRLLLSEDLQNGFTWRGVTIANPFTAEIHPLLSALLADRSSLHPDGVEAGSRSDRSGSRTKRRRRAR